MDGFTVIALVALPALILGLVVFLAVRDHRSRRTPFDDGEIDAPPGEQSEADAAARAAAMSRAGPF